MKKLIFATLLFISTQIFADEVPIVCANQGGLNAKLQNYEYVVSDDLNSVYILPSSAEYNKKAKTVQIWVTQFATPKWRQLAIEQLGEKYKNFGIVKQLDVFNLTTNKYQTLKYAFYSCNGDEIYSATFSANAKFDDIIPNSAIDSVLKNLKAKYK
jgi:hypothetical protein